MQIDADSKKVVLMCDTLMYSRARAEDGSHKALAITVTSSEMPFAAFHLINDRNELLKLRDAIDKVLGERGVETI